jgi:hypothetical protein
VKENNGKEIPIFKIRKILKNELKMKFKKIKRIPFSGNSERNILLR